MVFGKLEGMVALVTGAGGGENGGIGAGISRCMAREGARVGVNDLKEEYALATVEQLRAMGADAWPVPGDVSDPAQAAGIVAFTAEHFGQLDIMVNNAGVGGVGQGTDRLSNEEWLRVIGINLNGPFFTSRAAVPLMRARGFGRIINIASIGAIRATPANAAYPASKSALLGLTRHLAAEVAQHGITVNAILPGLTLTPLIKRDTTEQIRAAILTGIPAQRVASPEDTGWLAAFLASREAGYITGTAIPVDGGATLVPGRFYKFPEKKASHTISPR